jgi:hypothetical protein
MFRMGQGHDAIDPACAAAHTLGKLCPHTDTAASAVEGLTQMLLSPKDWRCGVAADTLANFGADAKAALPTLLSELKKAQSSDKPTVSGARCARAIGQIDSRAETDGSTITALTEALDSSDPDTQTEAANALARFGKNASGAMPKLRGLLNDRVYSTKAAAAKALNAMGEKTEVPKRAASGPGVLAP